MQPPSAEASTSAAPAAAASDALPEGWAQALDPTYNHVYYYNSSTGERTWERPKPKAPAPQAVRQWPLALRIEYYTELKFFAHCQGRRAV